MAEVSVRWKEAVFNDHTHVVTLEDCFRAYGAASGVHDFDFQDTVNEDFSDFTNWTGDALATWDVSGSQLSATGGGAAIWYEARYVAEVPPSFVATFDLVSGYGGFIFRGKTGLTTADCYMAYWNNANYGFARIDAAKAATALLVMPTPISAPAKVQVVVQWKLDSVDDTRKWLVMSLYVNGREYATYADDIGGTAYDWDEDYIGFVVTGASNMVVDNLTIQELRSIIEYSSMDPGESPQQGLSRAIGTTRLRMLGRYDGTMRVWKSANQSSSWTVPTSRSVQLADRSDYAAVLTHVRVIGAIHAVDHFGDVRGMAYLHRFSQVDNPNLMSEDEVYDEAEEIMADAEEQATSAQIQMPLQPLAEPWDVITYDSVDYRVEDVNHAVTGGAHGVPGPVTMLSVRKYVTR